MARRGTSIKYGGEDPSILPSNAIDTAPYVYSQCVDVYRLSNGNVTATRETVDFDTMSNYTNVQHLLVRVCGGSIPSDQEVRDYYGYTQVVQQDLRCPARVRIVDNRNNNVVADNFNASCEIIEKYTNPNYTIMYLDDITTTTTPTPTTTTTPTPTPTTVHVPPPEPEPEPEEPYVFTQCVDVYRVTHSDPYGHMMVWSKRETIDYQTLSDYVNVQNLLVRECGRDVPSDQEVLDYYGISQPTPTPPTPPTPTPTPTEPGQINWIPEPFFSFINNVFRK